MQTFDFYFAGELFDTKHLIGNAYLAAEIMEASEGKYRPVIPQDLEQRSLHPQDIRDEDILALLNTDLALFHFDGTELDSGTVVEFMIAKFADVPSVILRSDFRAAGDQEENPWNLMVSFYPRTEVVIVDALRSYKFAHSLSKNGSERLITDPRVSIERAQKLNAMVAKMVIHAFDRVSKQDPTMETNQQDAIFNWIKTMCGFRRSKSDLNQVFDRILERKRRNSK
jgi:nucleoside 2-deoxyribosyltransferase